MRSFVLLVALLAPSALSANPSSLPTPLSLRCVRDKSPDLVLVMINESTRSATLRYVPQGMPGAGIDTPVTLQAIDENTISLFESSDHSSRFEHTGFVIGRKTHYLISRATGKMEKKSWQVDQNGDYLSEGAINAAVREEQRAILADDKLSREEKLSAHFAAGVGSGLAATMNQTVTYECSTRVNKF